MDGSPSKPAVVGLALKKDKRQKHISDRLVQLAAEEGIAIRFIDKEAPLEAQGPFAAILQKVRKPEWEAALEAYAAAHPEVRILDPPAATYPLRNRGTMVSFLDGDGWLFTEPPELVETGRWPQRCRCAVPTSATLAAGSSLEAAEGQLAAAGLRYPLLAKPLWADGREGSHALAVVHTRQGLQRLVAGEVVHLRLPVLLQQYVDHGGCLFKVYVLGDTSVRVKRNSLHLPQWCCTAQQQQQQQPAAGAAAAGPAPPLQQQQRQGAGEACAPRPPLPDLELLDRVSAYPASKSWGRADTAPKASLGRRMPSCSPSLSGDRPFGHGVPSPPAWLLQALAQRLRHQTGLSLFNFDVIVPMHLHRRQERGSAAAEAPRLEEAPAAASAPGGSGASTQQDGGPSGAGEEPAVLDLSQAAAAAAAARAAAEQPGEAGGGGAGEGPQGAGQREESAEEGRDELLYHLIDINYFPGYEKMPNYEAYMVQFLRSIAL